MVDTIERAREAMARHNWVEAEEAFAAADRDGGLEAADLELFGTAAWWAGNPDTATEVLERTVGAYADAGQPVAAANVALALAYQAFRRRAEAIGGVTQL